MQALRLLFDYCCCPSFDAYKKADNCQTGMLIATKTNESDSLDWEWD